MWIDALHGGMTFLVGNEKVKFNLYQNTPLTDEEKKICMRIKSPLPLFEEHAPMFLQKDILEGFGIMANSLSTKELAFELISHVMEVDEFILTHNENDEGVLAMMDDKTSRSSKTSP